MPEQLTFDLPVRAAFGREAFFVTPSNDLAVAKLDQWRDWPERRLVLCGPTGAGKTHLADVWASETNAKIILAGELVDDRVVELAANSCLVIENADQIAGDQGREVAMFHLLNLIAAEGGNLLLTAATPPTRWPIALPDLKSRLSSIDVVSLLPPDDALLAALLVKLFRDRQIAVSPDLIPYLVARMDRSAIAAQDLVAELDRLALEQKRPVTRRLAAVLF